MSTTDPVDGHGLQTAPRLTIAASYQDLVSRALWVHKDMVLVQEPWAEEKHLGPVKRAEKFGDVESWASYVKRYGSSEDDEYMPFLVWSSGGLSAVLDYPTLAGEAGRCQWTAVHPFETSAQWRKWLALAGGQAVGQRQAVEMLEDLGADIVEPAAADLMGLLRMLRASVKATADAELRADGTSRVLFSDDRQLKAGAGLVELPAFFVIGIPVLRGHLDGEGRPVVYRLQVRLRVLVDESAHLAFRFSVPLAEQVLEDVYADRVRLARELLGEGFVLLRGVG